MESVIIKLCTITGSNCRCKLVKLAHLLNDYNLVILKLLNLTENLKTEKQIKVM